MSIKHQVALDVLLVILMHFVLYEVASIPTFLLFVLGFECLMFPIFITLLFSVIIYIAEVINFELKLWKMSQSLRNAIYLKMINSGEKSKRAEYYKERCEYEKILNEYLNPDVVQLCVNYCCFDESFSHRAKR